MALLGVTEVDWRKDCGGLSREDVKGLLRTVWSLRLLVAREYGIPPPAPGVSPKLGKRELLLSELGDCLNGGVNPPVMGLLASTL